MERVFETDIPARLDRLAWSRFHWLVVIALGVTWALDGLEVTIVGALGSVLEEPGTLGLSATQVGLAGTAYIAGALAGALIFGHLSQKFGRRNAIMLALVISLVSIPAWAFGTSLGVLVAGSYLMQTGVQGAFGVIPAHLNELSPDAVRSLFPGFVYQLGVLIASPATAIEFVLRDHFGYPWALTMFEATVIILMIVIFWFGPEARDRSFLRESEKKSTSA